MDAPTGTVNADSSGLRAISIGAAGPVGAEFREAFIAAFDEASAWLVSRTAPLERRVHLTRRSIKRLRAMLRLLKPSYGQKITPINAALRDAARALSGARDAAVVRQTLNKLRKKAATRAENDAIEKLLSLFPEEKAAPPGHAMGEAKSLIATARRVLATLHLHENHALTNNIIEGYVAIYRKGQKGLHASEENPTTDGLHEWRKAVQDRRYAAQLFRADWPEAGEAPAKALGTLSDHLGVDHDLAMVADFLEQVGEDEQLDFVECRALLTLVNRERVKRREKAFALGHELYGSKTGKIRKKWNDWASIRQKATNASAKPEPA